MWDVVETEEYLRRRKRYEKKHRRELRAVLNNFDTFMQMLRRGARLQQAKFGFIHPEPQGVLAIDQKGSGPNLAETRLYIYPDEASEVLYVLTLGDKRTQAADIETCKAIVRELHKKAQEPNGPQDHPEAGPDETLLERDGNGA